MEKIIIISIIAIIFLIIGLIYFRNRWPIRKFKNIKDYKTFNKALAPYGFSYDNYKDIFYSNIDAWQRDKGYCRLYDEAAAPLSMIIDCEPIYFDYGGKKWLIQFWKGQYGMTTGVEIGVYNSSGPDLDTKYFKGTFYDCANDDELLDMSFTLLYKGKTIMRRRASHWWLTGFVLGKFSEPWDLVAYIDIHLKDNEMRDAFVKGLINAGYKHQEINIIGNTVVLTFDKPRTSQPYSRNPMTDELIQKKNKVLCDRYKDLTGPYDTMLDKINAVQERDPDLLKNLLSLGKPKELFQVFKK